MGPPLYNEQIVNDRIKERLIEAGVYTTLTNGRVYPVEMTAEETEEALQKFAELIIKDCQGIVSSVRYLCELPSSEFPSAPALRMAEKNIGAYFGVEQ